MSTISQPSPLSQSDWNELFALLSLDNVLDLYSNLSLALKEPAGFHRHLQACIREARRRQDDVVGGRIMASELILDCLRAQTGDDFGRFLQWSREAFIGAHADQPQVSVWDIVFSQWSNGRSWPPDIAPEKMASLAGDYKARCSRNGLDAKIAAIKLKPVSDWDVEIYARHNWNHFDDINDPFISLSVMASVHCARKFLETLLRDWTPQELEALTRGAQAVVNSLGVWMPGPVPAPEEALRA